MGAVARAVSFGTFMLDPGRRQLLRAGSPVHLAPKALDLLVVLVRERPRAVSKQDLFREVWPQTFVTDNVLATLVTDIRTALGDDARRPRFIRTVHGFGYAFDAGTEDHSSFPARQSPWVLLVGDREIRLASGEHVLGRAGADIEVEGPTVSKRHARLVVSDDAIHVEDLASKNGTFVGAEPVTATRRLRPGDRLLLGHSSCTVRLLPHSSTTETARPRTPNP